MGLGIERKSEGETGELPKPTEQMPNTTGPAWTEPVRSLPGVFLSVGSPSPFQGGPMMWYILGLGLAVVAAAAYVLSRRPARRATIVLERN